MPAFDFEEVFGDDYLHFYAGLLTDERSDTDVEVVARLLELRSGMRVLDIPCGHGRIANRLAAFGCHVVGVDSSPAFLDVARRAGTGAAFQQADMREFEPESGGFDAVVNWFTSFGYFDEATDREILGRWRRALRPRGKLLVEGQNPTRLLTAVQALGGAVDHVTERGDDLLIDRTRYDVASGRTETERISVRGGRVRRYRFSVRLFSFAELREWLLAAGFGEAVGYGHEGEPFSLSSRRMIVVATV